MPEIEPTSGLEKNVRHIGMFLPVDTAIVAIDALFCTRLPNFVQIGPPAAE